MVHLFGSTKDASIPSNGFASQFDAGLARMEVLSSITPARVSEKRNELVRAMRVAYTRLSSQSVPSDGAKSFYVSR